MACPVQLGNMTHRPTCASVLSACLRLRINENKALTGAALAVSVFAFFLRFFSRAFNSYAFFYYPCAYAYAHKRAAICSC